MCCFEAARANKNEIGKRIRECASSIRTFYFLAPKSHYAPINAALEAEYGFCLSSLSVKIILRPNDNFSPKVQAETEWKPVENEDEE